jgi:rRNA maturation RNase YbeY
MGDIQFFYMSQVSVLRNRIALKAFIEMTAFKYKRPIASLNIIFCDDAYLLSINQQFLQHDFYTDIITFDLGTSSKEPIQAEIYISVDRVKENAKLHAVSLKRELHRVIFHGLLHLLGYKDKLKKDQLTMRSMEDALLLHYFGK